MAGLVPRSRPRNPGTKLCLTLLAVYTAYIVWVGGDYMAMYRFFAPVIPLLYLLVGRAAATGDVDGDGDLDVLITQAGRAPALLRNDQQLGHHWLRVRLVDERPGANRDGLGARLELEADGSLQHRRVMPSRSYLAQVGTA